MDGNIFGVEKNNEVKPKAWIMEMLLFVTSQRAGFNFGGKKDQAEVAKVVFLAFMPNLLTMLEINSTKNTDARL